MIIQDRLLSKYGGNLSFSNLEEELKKLNITFGDVNNSSTTFLPSRWLRYKDKPISIVYGSFSELTQEDILETVKQLEKILINEIKINISLAHEVKLLLVKERLEQNKK